MALCQRHVLSLFLLPRAPCRCVLFQPHTAVILSHASCNHVCADRPRHATHPQHTPPTTAMCVLLCVALSTVCLLLLLPVSVAGMVGRGRAVTVPPLLSVLVLLALLAAPADAWQEWTWNGEGPGTRGGHSLHVYKDSVFLFGGRGVCVCVCACVCACGCGRGESCSTGPHTRRPATGTDLEVPHQPRTYEIAENDGVLSFNTYDQRLVKDCGNDTTLACLNITIGLYHNDVWEYQLDCDRYDDFECAFQGWIPFHRGAALGGCELINQLEFCTHPSERYDHASTIFSDG